MRFLNTSSFVLCFKFCFVCFEFYDFGSQLMEFYSTSLRRTPVPKPHFSPVFYCGARYTIPFFGRYLMLFPKLPAQVLSVASSLFLLPRGKDAPIHFDSLYFIFHFNFKFLAIKSIHHTPFTIDANYSVRKLFTGFTTAAFNAWWAIVSAAITTDTLMAIKNIPPFIFTW